MKVHGCSFYHSCNFSDDLKFFKKINSYKECYCRGGVWEVGKIGERGQKVHISNHKIKKS